MWLVECRTSFTVQTKTNPSNVAYTAKTLGLHTDQPTLIYQPGVSHILGTSPLVMLIVFSFVSRCRCFTALSRLQLMEVIIPSPTVSELPTTWRCVIFTSKCGFCDFIIFFCFFNSFAQSLDRESFDILRKTLIIYEDKNVDATDFHMKTRRPVITYTVNDIF